MHYVYNNQLHLNVSFSFVAIDMTEDILKALDDIIRLGFDRVLTSGGCATAHEGVDVLQKMVKQVQLKYTNSAFSYFNYHCSC